MLFKKKTSSVEYLIVGLGNFDSKYDNTRHNIGFMAVDYIAEKQRAPISKKKFKSLVSDCEIGGVRVLLLKPQTYMNLSGEAVLQAANFYKIPVEKIIVIFDDVTLPIKQIRIRNKGSAGGHNGIKSIISCISSEDFPRIKIGIGSKPHPNYDLADWVLSKFKNDELITLEPVYEDVLQAVILMLENKQDVAMNRYN